MLSRHSTSKTLSNGGSRSVVSNTSEEEERYPSSSDDDTTDEAVLKDNDIKLQQMKRVAQKKRNHRDPSARPQVSI